MTFVGYFVALIGLLFGGAGQAICYGPLLEPYLPDWILVMPFLLPWLIFFALTFFKQPLLPPRPYRHCLTFAMCWYAFLTILAEVLKYFDLIPPDPKPNAENGWFLMHAGWLSFIPMIQLCLFARRYELGKGVPEKKEE